MDSGFRRNDGGERAGITDSPALVNSSAATLVILATTYLVTPAKAGVHAFKT